MDPLNGRNQDVALLNLALPRTRAHHRLWEIGLCETAISLILFVCKDYDCYLVYYGIEAWRMEIERYRYV